MKEALLWDGVVVEHWSGCWWGWAQDGTDYAMCMVMLVGFLRSENSEWTVASFDVLMRGRCQSS